MKYKIVIHSKPSEVYTPDCLDSAVNKPITVTDDFGGRKSGHLVSYEVRRNGHELVIVLDVAGDLLANPPLNAAAVFSMAGAQRSAPTFPRRGKRYTGQREFNR